MASFAIQNASQLDEIGFPEFTTKLITDIFEAILKSNIQQLEAYSNLVEKLSKTITVFINETKDDIDAEEILDFLSVSGVTDSVVFALSKEEDRTKVLNTIPVEGTNITDQDLAPITSAVVSPTSEYTNPIVVDASITIDDLRKAVANRISQSKYQLLKDMTRIGLIRTYPESGHIKTKLLFNTYDFSSYVQNSVDAKNETKGFNASVGGVFNKILGKNKGSFNLSGGISGGWSKVTVKTVTERTIKNTGTNIDVLGEVVLNIKTDVLPLSGQIS